MSTSKPPEVEAAYRLIDAHLAISRIDSCTDYHLISIENLQVEREAALAAYHKAQGEMAFFDLDLSETRLASPEAETQSAIPNEETRSAIPRGTNIMNEIYVIIRHSYDEDHGIFVDDVQPLYYASQAAADNAADGLNDESRLTLDAELDQEDAYAVARGGKPMSWNSRRKTHEFRDTYEVVMLLPGDAS